MADLSMAALKLETTAKKLSVCRPGFDQQPPPEAQSRLKDLAIQVLGSINSLHPKLKAGSKTPGSAIQVLGSQPPPKAQSRLKEPGLSDKGPKFAARTLIVEI
jgi:predicted secreted protein